MMNTSNYHRQYLAKGWFLKEFNSSQVFPKLPTAQSWDFCQTHLLFSFFGYIYYSHSYNLKTSTTSVIGGSSHGWIKWGMLVDTVEDSIVSIVTTVQFYRCGTHDRPYYRPQTKLCESYVFTGVCRSIERGLCPEGLCPGGSLSR